MLFNNLTTGLFLVAAIGELVGAGDLRARWPRVAYPVALVLLARRPGVPGARPRRPAAVPSHAAGLQAELADVAGDLVPDDLRARPDGRRRGRIRAGGRVGARRFGCRVVDPYARGGPRPAVRVRVGSLQGGAVQHDGPAGLEGRAVARRVPRELCRDARRSRAPRDRCADGRAVGRRCASSGRRAAHPAQSGRARAAGRRSPSALVPALRPEEGRRCRCCSCSSPGS